MVTKVGARRGDDGSWIPSLTPESLIQQVHENLGHLGLEALDVVNLRVGGPETPGGDSLAEPFSALAELQRQGLIRHLGVSGVTWGQGNGQSLVGPRREVEQVKCRQSLQSQRAKANLVVPLHLPERASSHRPTTHPSPRRRGPDHATRSIHARLAPFPGRVLSLAGSGEVRIGAAR